MKRLGSSKDALLKANAPGEGYKKKRREEKEREKRRTHRLLSARRKVWQKK